MSESVGGQAGIQPEPLRVGTIFCRGCGKQIHETAPTCPNCGAVQASTSKNWWADKTNRLIVLAYVGAVVLPFAGIIGGVGLLLRKQVLLGLLAIVLSLMMIGFWTDFWPAFDAAYQTTRYR